MQIKTYFFLHDIDVLIACIDRNSSTPVMTTVHPPVTLTAILLSSLQPDSEKLSSLEPFGDVTETTTTIISTTSAPTATSHTIEQSQTPVQPTSFTTAATATTESSDLLTTIYKSGDYLPFF